MGILSDINTTIKDTDKFLYDDFYEKLKRSAAYFSNVALRRGREHPYLQINDARDDIRLHRTGVFVFDNIHYKDDHYQSFDTILPDWLEFKAKYNAYAKKYGYKPYINILYDKDYYGRLMFSNGEYIKEFSNCIIRLVEM